MVPPTKQNAMSAALSSIQNKLEAAEKACSECNGPMYSQGLNTYRVPMALYELNRARLVKSMTETLLQERLENNEEKVSESSQLPRGVILLEGGKQQTRYSTDHEPLFRQESYFHWAFGVADSDVYGAISLPSGEATLFVPRYGITYEIFCGSNPPLEDLKSKYGVEKVLPVDDLDSFLKSELGDDNKNDLFLLQGPNSDSGNLAQPATFDGINDYDAQRNTNTLFRAMTELRVRKTQPEIELMKYTNHISSMAHVEVMRSCKPGMMEYQLESLFQHHTYFHGGCRIMSYTSICATGWNPSILHYGYSGKPNDKLIENGDMALLDMGAEYHCYASDITCSFPVNGKFTEDQLLVYNAVLDAQLSVIQLMRPGVSWLEMHKVAETAILKALQKGGLVKGDIEEMIDADLGAVFMPHGLGHLIGIDTHDVGGYMDGITPTRSKRPGKDKLRTARNLEEGMVITLEPGCYFVDILLDQALADPEQAKFLNSDRIKDFRGFGGVRLEENVAITKDGCEDLTTCPRAVSEVVDVMSGKPWPPTKDVLPELKRNWAVRNDDGTIVRTDLSSSD